MYFNKKMLLLFEIGASTKCQFYRFSFSLLFHISHTLRFCKILQSKWYKKTSNNTKTESEYLISICLKALNEKTELKKQSEL